MNNLSIALYYIAFVILASVFSKKDANISKDRLPLVESKNHKSYGSLSKSSTYVEGIKRYAQPLRLPKE